MSHYYSEKPDSQLKLRNVTGIIRGNELKFYLASGVFSSKKIDKGALLLANSAHIKEGSRVLDLGCGNGIIGIAVARACPGCKVVMADINERAVKTAKLNIKLNNASNALAIKSDGFQEIKSKFDVVLFNPPQTAGKELCHKLIRESKNFLDKGGTLQLVARHNKGGKSLNSFMQEVFGGSVVIQRSGGYRVYANA